MLHSERLALSLFLSRVLKIHTFAGEVIGNKGIVELGKTARIHAIAEVYKTDIRKIRIGQRATII